MVKSPMPRLNHMLEAMDDIQEIIKGKSAVDIEKDRHCRLLMERNFEILSEASRRLPDDLKERHPNIPWQKIAGIGNVLRHDYDEVAARLLLEVALKQLPILAAICREELQKQN